MGISVALTPATTVVTVSKSMITNASFRTKKLPGKFSYLDESHLLFPPLHSILFIFSTLFLKYCKTFKKHYLNHHLVLWASLHCKRKLKKFCLSSTSAKRGLFAGHARRTLVFNTQIYSFAYRNYKGLRRNRHRLTKNFKISKSISNRGKFKTTQIYFLVINFES